ncbi:hypothetical protein [Micromonospora sp. CA-111912]|uniref:hypothetical protein n=1 Tax=Micromonospora sp. CA-111912 TaxID=3239955 RepID=UPI003D930343
MSRVAASLRGPRYGGIIGPTSGGSYGTGSLGDGAGLGAGFGTAGAGSRCGFAARYARQTWHAQCRPRRDR